MKEWRTPEVEEINFTETKYGGSTTTQFDYIYQNAEGNWEGTFVAS